MDGRSRLVCRFVHPQCPPAHIDVMDDPFAIEKAARYVALIPFLRDDEISSLADLWCTNQEFLNIQCGDWEEHAILLCNYFNYIDRYRKEYVSRFSNEHVQSYCMLCDTLPEGSIMMVLRRDMITGHCEAWEAVSGKCYFLPMRPSRGWCCSLRRQSSDATSLKATPLNPIQRVHCLFNAENIWASLQGTKFSVNDFDFDVTNASAWKRLFKGGKAELDRLSRKPGARSSSKTDTAADAVAMIASVDLEIDPALKLVYEAADDHNARSLENKIEQRLEDEIRECRAMGEHGGLQQATAFNRHLGDRLIDLLDDLERVSHCSRRHGNESVFPLRSDVPQPVSFQAIEAKMHQIEQAFQTASGRGHCVYGLPFHQPYTDFSDIWAAVRDSRVLELGDEKSEYALKVRVFAYPSRVLSVWIFIACSMSM